MPSFVVDPLLCTVPEPLGPGDETHRWLSSLEAWLLAAQASPFDWKHVHACTTALVELGRLPTFSSLRAAQGATGASVNVGGLLRHVTRFFQDAERDILAVTATQCAVVAEPDPRVTPPEILARNLPEVRAPLCDGLLCLACDKAAGEAFAKDARLVTAPLAGPTRELLIEATISLIEPDGMTKRMGGDALAQRFPLLFSPAQLDDFRYEALLAGGEQHLPALVTSIAGSLYPGQPLLAVRAGSHLWQSMAKAGILENRFASEKLLRICAVVLVGRHEELNIDRRPLRETQAPDSPQQTRKSDGAKAWRLTITKEGAGYRLHYWHTPARGEQIEQIELANVLLERDPKVIPET